MAEKNEAAERVLQIVKEKGPVIPTQISSEIGTNSILASALLSELVGNKQLRISSVKVGGTPLYYAPGQEEKLQDYTKYLHDKEKKAFDALKEHKVLRDNVLDPVTRVALRQIKDFAVPLTVQNNGDVETFWKWYLISNDDAEPLIRKVLGIGEESAEKPSKDAAARKEGQQTLEKPKAGRAAKKDAGEFARKLDDYFSRNSIEIVETIDAKRKGEAEFVISVPSSVGTIKYYCRAKDKKTCNDGDLSSAYVQGQVRKLPVLFLTTGKLTKKAADMLNREFSNMNVKAI